MDENSNLNRGREMAALVMKLIDLAHDETDDDEIHYKAAALFLVACGTSIKATDEEMCDLVVQMSNSVKRGAMMANLMAKMRKA